MSTSSKFNESNLMNPILISKKWTFIEARNKFSYGNYNQS